ncbi:MAG: N-acetylmuramoyl-L-alanine amidase [Butyrivibrio sp.]|nr:N-acetylmuramoyl-L-alanine amidase [Butyrivibrio sp.]
MNNITYDGARLQDPGEEIVIVIDPGHGGTNLGTTGNDHLEKEMTLTTATAMYEELSKYDNVTVYMTRIDDTELSLLERAQFAADKEADFLFSIHYNASVYHNLFGSEVWIASDAPFHAFGYQFGSVQLQTMSEMGLFLRGVKTKIGKTGENYYGIIRESTRLGIPSCIIEHCHVDQERDSIFCENDEDLIAFGKADATSVAKYLGLKSTELSVDYSEYAATSLANISMDTTSTYAYNLKKAPQYCEIELTSVDYDTGEVTIHVSGKDLNNTIIYFDYSLDAGLNWSEYNPWPESNTIYNTYAEGFDITITIPSGVKPNVIFRAYNQFDARTKSNTLILNRFNYEEKYRTLEELAESHGINKYKTYSYETGWRLFPEAFDKLEHSSLGIFTCIAINTLLMLIVLFTLAGSIIRSKRKRLRK